jgi:PBP1b-binding outer membrane lipoprotein LpoB
MKEMMLLFLFALMLFSGCAEKQETALDQNPAEITTQTTIQMEEADKNDDLPLDTMIADEGKNEASSWEAIGFVKMQPLIPSISYEAASGKFSSSFTNAAGAKITIREVTVSDKSGNPEKCEEIYARDSEVKAGAAFPIGAQCVGIKKKGEKCMLDISIEYNVTIGAMTVSHIDRGVLTGLAE